MSFRAPMQL